MADTNTIVTKLDKTTYAAGEVMTLTFTGGVTRTSDVNLTNLTAVMSLSDGSKVNVVIPATLIKDGQVSNLTAKLSSISDPSGRVWTVSADGSKATAIA